MYGKPEAVALPPDTQFVVLPLKNSAALACGRCADRLEEGVRALPGVTSATFDSASATLTVSFIATRVHRAFIEAEIERFVGDLAREFGHRTFRVGGMDCADCARSIEKGVGALPGVLSASVNFPAARLRVEYTAGTSGVEQVAQRARSLGFTVEDVAQAAHGESDAGPFVRGDALRVGVSGALLAVGLALEHVAHAPAVWTDVALAGSVVAGGYRFALAGLSALRTRTVGTNLLMAVAAVGAVLLGHWEEAAAVVFLYALGEALEGAAMERTRRSLRGLIDAAPPTALVRRADGSEASVAASELELGDVVIVRPGAKLPADGVVLSGDSAVAEAAITGESLPRDKRPGDAVYAGSLNGEGALLVRVTAAGADSTLARILHLVEEAQAQKAPVQALVERFGRVYTPLVLASAALLALVGPLVAPGQNWVYRALTLLVVSCPCALVIATPVAFVSGIARAARGGVLVKGGAHLEALAGVRAVAFDKTGTLTRGEPRVTDVRAAAGVSEDDLLTAAAAVERRSEHPLAAAVVDEAERRGRSAGLPNADATRAVPGRGVTATVAGESVLVGSAALLAEHRVAMPEELRDDAGRFAADGKTCLFVAGGGRVLGLLAVADTPRPEAAETIASLRRAGLEPVMLTGDVAAVARSVAADVGISDVRAGQLPQDKLAAVRELAACTRGGVAFVGDGINDAPALAAATVGVAMGAGGTAAALEAADVALMAADLRRLPWAVRLARATRAVVRQNVAISVGAVVVLLLTTVTGVLSLPLGVLGHEGSALLVILNGLRLLSPRLTRLDD